MVISNPAPNSNFSKKDKNKEQTYYSFMLTEKVKEMRKDCIILNVIATYVFFYHQAQLFRFNSFSDKTNIKYI